MVSASVNIVVAVKWVVESISLCLAVTSFRLFWSTTASLCSLVISSSTNPCHAFSQSGWILVQQSPIKVFWSTITQRTRKYNGLQSITLCEKSFSKQPLGLVISGRTIIRFQSHAPFVTRTSRKRIDRAGLVMKQFRKAEVAN